MKPLEHVVILIEPGDAGVLRDGTPSPTQREFDEYDRFAAELQQHTRARVEVVECALESAPRDGLLLIAYHIGMREKLSAMDLGGGRETKPILINVDYKEAFTLAEPAQPAGIVSSERFIRWVLRQDDRVFRQIYGLKSLAGLLAPAMRPTAMGESEHYCVYGSDEVLTLPQALIAYIGAYWRSLS
jgi:hypothetical protein